MSHLLWKYYWEDDVDKFRRLLAPAGYAPQNPGKGPAIGTSGSPGAFGSSPRITAKSRKASGHGLTPGSAKNVNTNLGRNEVNCRDHVGLTILLRAASSTSPNAIEFVEALIGHPAIDLYAQDPESGWNALHRALYTGNISTARLLLEKERRDLTENLGSAVSRIGQLIKTKDHEGNSPFDVYNATIALRSLRTIEDTAHSEDGSDIDETGSTEGNRAITFHGLGDEVFAFGSNKNLSLGFGDEDDRQYPERVSLRRPENLVRQFYNEYLSQRSTRDSPAQVDDDSEIPALVQNRRLVIQDVTLSKLHSAILTTDPVSNLYICGVGRGGRLGLGDENTRFNFVPVHGGLAEKKVTEVALGQNHSMAITDPGELWTWGSNSNAQLGYVLPPPGKPDEEPMSTTPRQVFGPLKKEIIRGIAASAIHSVAHTGTSLYCWGKNAGQLGIMDADSRSLEVQAIPRKVAAALVSSHSIILTVSAIERATTCLFADHTVCVFTSYGYNMIRFNFADVFMNSKLQRTGKFISSRYDPRSREIHQVTSGGDTIAAVTGSGDLFAMTLNNKVEGNLSATSTTNPSKIKDAVSQPQCIWSARKDGVESISIGENGSVMISTQSGAVWRRVRRAKAKDTQFAKMADSRRKDYKFQRVPYITNIAAVRSSTFGAYAAIRKDCDVTREQIDIDEPSLWDDIYPLLALRGFKASNSRTRANKDTGRFFQPEVLKGRVDALGYEILTSTDLEEDLTAHLRDWQYKNDGLGTVMRTSTAPELKIPVHSWILAARSPVLRSALQQYRDTGMNENSEVFTIEESDDATVITLLGLDLITLLNLAIYMYRDKVVPAWNFTRQSPPLAYRYRQVRTELMKVALKLQMGKLEAAARLQNTPQRSMDEDFKNAIQDVAFFEDGDALLELDGDEIPVHSTMLCQRCPWFEGLFNGRSRGMWLASRRAAQDPLDKVPIDMKHIDPESFHYVLQYLYADVGEELFNDVVSENIDEFSELVLDVMSIANELMLDRLSQICQHVIGRFVTTRNISNLLNTISPCSVTEFKDKGLEYICLQMESMLENHLLDDLDEDLLLELDQVVRDNQLARCPFAKSGRADLLLHERYPDLVEDIEEERQRRVKELAYKFNQRDEEKKLSSSFKTRFGSLDESSGVSPTPDRLRRKSKAVINEPFSPDLRPKDSQADLIFDMDEEASSDVETPSSPSLRKSGHVTPGELDQLTPLAEPWQTPKAKAGEKQLGTSISSSLETRPAIPGMKSSLDYKKQAQKAGSPWAPATLPTSRLDLREVLSEGKPAHSALSAGLAAEKKDISAKPMPQKISQKERKKQMQQQAEHAARVEAQAQASPQSAWRQASSEKKSAPWQQQGTAPKTSLKDLLSPDANDHSSAPIPTPKSLVAAESTKSIRRTASPDTRFSGQSRKNSAPAPSTSSPSGSKPVRPANTPLVPHSKSYKQQTPKSEPVLGLSMTDIIGQQQREQEIVKEAVAKRSLQEIQQEQAFQEWWEAESRRTQEEEAQRQAKDKSKGEKKGRSKRPRGGGRTGGKNGETSAGASGSVDSSSNNVSSRGRGRGRGGKA